MKKICLAVSLLSVLLLTSCKTPGSGTSFGDDSYVISSIDPEDLKTCKVYFFLDYLNASTVDPYHTYNWFQNEVLDPTQKPEDPVTPPDPNFPTFLGWSDHSLIDDVEDLWDFENDITPKKDKFLYLYGIWVD